MKNASSTADASYLQDAIDTYFQKGKGRYTYKKKKGKGEGKGKKGKKGKKQKYDKRNVICHKCKGKGHFARECTNKRQKVYHENGEDNDDGNQDGDDDGPTFFMSEFENANNYD